MVCFYENERCVFSVQCSYNIYCTWSEEAKKRMNIKRSFRLPHVKLFTIIHVIIMLILCWHWNSFLFVQKLRHNIQRRKSNFYSSNFFDCYFLGPIPPPSSLSMIPCHNSSSGMLNVVTLRFCYIYVNFNRTLYINQTR